MGHQALRETLVRLWRIKKAGLPRIQGKPAFSIGPKLVTYYKADII